MTDSKKRFEVHLEVAHACIRNYDNNGEDFALRHVWIASVSAFDLYMTEVVSEVGLRWIDRAPPVLTANLRQVRVPLGSVLNVINLSPTELLLFYKDHVYSAVQYTSFYKPEKVSEALSYIWICQPKEKWSRIFGRMAHSGHYEGRTEQDVREELSLIGDRRDLIAHSVDSSPGALVPNQVFRNDAAQVVQFIADLATAIDDETEAQLESAATA